MNNPEVQPTRTLRRTLLSGAAANFSSLQIESMIFTLLKTAY